VPTRELPIPQRFAAGSRLLFAAGRSNFYTKTMDIVRSTEKYEAWLGERIPLIQADLDRKHALMS
jgi:hypothetical protein